MKKLLSLIIILSSTSLFSQIISGIEGTFDVRDDYSTITVYYTTHKLYGPKVSFDGYDTVTVRMKKTEILDGDRVTQGKGIWKITKTTSFWITFLEKYGYELSNSNITPVISFGKYVTPGTTTLIFKK